MPKRYLFIPATWIAVLVFFSLSWSQCPEDTVDLGICDTIYVETFDCDHIYEAESGSFDSVRVAIYVTHDSNTFWWESESKWAQDSIRYFCVPLVFWHQPEGCADSVVFPRSDDWNNTYISPAMPEMKRSLFRHIVDTHTGDTVYNRLLQMVENGKPDWGVYLDFESHSCDGDSGHVFLHPFATLSQKWWEGSRVLLATLTFHVYMSEDCDATEIGIDSTFWSPCSPLDFLRYDYADYVPRHFLPVKDTIHLPFTCGDCNGDDIIDVGDVVCLIGYLYAGASGPQPLCTGDVDCNSEVDNGDLIYLINYLFLGTSAPCTACCSQ